MRSTSPIRTNDKTRFVFVTGGVVSGLGKGITISSLGRLLRSMDLKVTCIKIDPYLNTDAGTMSPFEHGETFVLDDGGETDLDLGNYERFLDINLTKDHNITTGKVYSTVIEKERTGDYLGKTVQVVPHITDEIQERISKVSKLSVDSSGEAPDICLVEIGGTVGDIESSVFLEALRQFIVRVGRDKCCLLHVSLVVTLGEQKTKPTQHSIKTLMGLGLLPDVIVCRSNKPLEETVRRKISAFCHVSPLNVVSVHDCSNIYHVPLILHQQKLEKIVLKRLGLEKYLDRSVDLKEWREIANVVDTATEVVKIALVGKYTKLSDAYLSVNKAIKHASIAHNLKLKLISIDSSYLEVEQTGTKEYIESWALLEEADGIIIPGGFGKRGVEGMIKAINFARIKKTPILGICLGLQTMIIEYSRNVLSLKDAHSAEFCSDSKNKVIFEMLEHHTGKMGGTMRLGSRITKVDAKSLASKLYKNKTEVIERHRHRYEVNPAYVERLEENGMKFVGKDVKGERMEIIELDRKDHPFFVGVQYHPELKSRPINNKLSPPFEGLILAASGRFDEFYSSS